MATRTRIVDGKTVVTQLKSSTEDTARLKREVKLRRDRAVLQNKADDIKRRGGSAAVEIIKGEAQLIQVKPAEKVAILTESSGRKRELTKFDLIKFNAEQAKNIKDVQIQNAFAEAVNKTRAQSFQRPIIKPEIIKIIDEAVAKRKGVSVAPRDFLTANDLESRGIDSKKFFDLRRKGFNVSTSMQQGFSERAKQVKALEKVDLIQRRLDKWRSNSNVFITNSVKRFGLSDTFVGKDVELTLQKLNRWLNPIVIGSEIGGSLEQFRTLREAGIIDPAKVFIGVPAAFIVKVVTNPVASGKATFNSALKLIPFIAGNLNPKTAEGRSNIILLSIIARPDKILNKKAKQLISKLKGAMLKSKKVGAQAKRILTSVARAPLIPLVGAGGRGGKVVSKATQRSRSLAIKSLRKKAGRGGKGPKAKTSGVPIQEIRKTQRVSKQLEAKALNIAKQVEKSRVFDAAIPRKILKQQSMKGLKKGKTFSKGRMSKGELRKIIPSNSVEAKKFGLISKSRSKGKIAKDLRLKGSFKEQLEIVNGKLVGKGFSNKVNAAKTFNRGIRKNIGGGDQRTITKQVSKVIKNVKSKINSLSKKVIDKPKLVKPNFTKTADVVVKDLRPEKLFPNLIVPETNFNTGGFRKGVKDKLMKSLFNQKRVLEEARRKAFKSFINNVNQGIAKSNRLQSKGVQSIINKLTALPKITDLIKFGFSKSTARLVNNSLRALSLLSFGVGIADAVIRIAGSIPIAEVKPISVVDIVLEDVVPITTKVVKKTVVRKPSRLVSVVKRVVRKPVKKRAVRKVSKPVGAKKKKIPKVLFPFPPSNLPKLKKGERFTYVILVKRAGKIVRLKEKLTLNRAKTKLLKLLDNNIGRSGELHVSGKTRKKDVKRVSMKGFRARKNKKSKALRVVEVIRKALDTKGEKRQIKAARARARRKR